MTAMPVTGHRDMRDPAAIVQDEQGEVSVADLVMRYLKIGHALDEAAQKAGVSRSTVTGWLARGRKAFDEGSTEEAEQPFIEFAEAVEDSRLYWKGTAIASVWAQGQGIKNVETVTTTEYDATGKVTSKKTVTKEGVDRDWRAIVKLLEARYPGEFKRGERLEITGDGGGAIRVEHEIPPEIWQAAIQTLIQLDAEVLEIEATETPLEQIPGAPSTNGETAGVLPND